MTDLPRGQLVVYAVAAIAVLALGLRYLRSDPSPAAGPAAAPADGAQPGFGTPGDAGSSPGNGAEVSVRGTSGGPATVHVAGEVHRPGVYRLRAGARVEDAVKRAGGARHGADLSAVNLAAHLEDGRQILVPKRAPAGVPAAGVAGSAVGAGGLPPAAAGAPAVPIDLNTATAEQLDTLDGVGPATAAKILQYRQEHNGFGSVEELGQVPGIGEKRLAALRARLRV